MVSRSLDVGINYRVEYSRRRAINSARARLAAKRLARAEYVRYVLSALDDLTLSPRVTPDFFLSQGDLVVTRAVWRRIDRVHFSRGLYSLKRHFDSYNM